MSPVDIDLARIILFTSMVAALLFLGLYIYAELVSLAIRGGGSDV